MTDQTAAGLAEQAIRRKPDAQLVRDVFTYDQETGVFLWKKKIAVRHKVGDRADSFHAQEGYRKISLNYQNFPAHRVAWLYVHGEWPTHMIDHINGIKSDNRICNLRLATNQMNVQNVRRARSNSRTQILGVSKRGEKYVSGIRANGKRYHLGTFVTAEEASAAYRNAKRAMHIGSVQ